MKTDLHREAEKRKFSFVCIFSMLDRNWLIFSHTLRKVQATILCISFRHALRILCNNEIETTNTMT